MSMNGARDPRLPRWAGIAIAAAMVVSTLAYFGLSEGVRGQISFVSKAADKVLSKLNPGRR